jgi:taurine dioxygenase
MVSFKGHFPAVIEGLDCRHVTPYGAKELLFALFRHRVLVIRGQNLVPAQFADFMRRLGPTVPHVLSQFRVDGLPDIISLSNLYDADGRPTGVHEGGAYWHADMSYLKLSSGILTGLYSVKIPAVGGETEFIDGVGALQRFRAQAANGSLPGEIARFDRPDTRVKHRFGNRARLRHRNAHWQPTTDAQAKTLKEDVVHPLIMPHPVIGTESLYAVAGTAFLVDDLAPDDSCDVLDRIFEFMHTVGPRYSHTYDRGDLVIWDNASTLHRGTEIPPSRDPDNCRLLLRANVDYAASPVVRGS